ncbi:MAG TPA: hypothetical protein VD948_04865, partial [Rhodothermales bacterium]|nr:hypothetical protein [Rhodothermales bacterium]
MTYRNTSDHLAGIRAIAQDRLKKNKTDGEAAVLLGLVANAERKHFEEVTALRLALDALVDDEPCQYDHHGYCQAHSLGKPCSNAVGKALLTGPLTSDWMRLWDAASEAYLAYLHAAREEH